MDFAVINVLGVPAFDLFFSIVFWSGAIIFGFVLAVKAMMSSHY